MDLCLAAVSMQEPVKVAVRVSVCGLDTGGFVAMCASEFVLKKVLLE